jgi:hypothetical protein
VKVKLSSFPLFSLLLSFVICFATSSLQLIKEGAANEKLDYHFNTFNSYLLFGFNIVNSKKEIEYMVREKDA